MSYQDGWDALNLRPTSRVPRSELSAGKHWQLVAKVTGLPTQTRDERVRASAAFIKAWNWDFFWYVYPCVGRPVACKPWSDFPDHGGPDFLVRNNPAARRTSMGHAAYEEKVDGQSDFSQNAETAFATIDEALALDPMKEYGSFDLDALAKEFQGVYDEMTTLCPDTVHMGGVYITLFSGLIEIFGWEMLLELIMEEDFPKVVDGYFEWVGQLFAAYAKTSIPVFNSHDDLVWTSGPAARPEWYREHIFPKYKKLWGPLKQAGKKIIFTCDGDMTVFFDDIVDAGADMIVTEPMSDFDLFAQKYGKTHAFFGVMDTRVLAFGSKDDIFREVQRVMDRHRDCPGFFMGVGNHIPQNTPVDNALWYNEAYEKFSRR